MTESKPVLYPGFWAEKTPDKPAVIMADDGSTLSYRELDAFANRLGRFYQWFGLNTGEHVAYCLENRVECPALQWGAHYVGLYYTFISTRLTGPEAAYIAADCGAKVVIVSAKTAALVADAIRGLDNAPSV